ncbi:MULTISPECIES: sigma-70 family RNA polymerase sigma factor [unclassified Parabacteroides]|nr:MULTISPECIES: sigma-70 family RNA polymerase sigma factor [unclassified Parabacteroides]
MELEGFKITVLPLRGKLLNISRKLLEEEIDSEDVVQEAFLKLWHIRDKLDEYQNVEALAVMVTKNLALDKLRTRKSMVEESNLYTYDSGMKNPAELLEQQDAIACIRHLIEHLPTLQQTIIRMKDIEGYELSEIAEITGSQVEAVRVNLSRARKKVREQFLALNQSGYEY